MIARGRNSKKYTYINYNLASFLFITLVNTMEETTLKIIVGSLTAVSLGLAYITSLWVIDNFVHSQTNSEKLNKLTTKVQELFPQVEQLSRDKENLQNENKFLSDSLLASMTKAEALQHKLAGCLKYVQLLETRNQVLREALLTRTSGLFKTLTNVKEASQNHQGFDEALSGYIFNAAKDHRNLKTVLSHEEEDLITKKKEFYLSSTYEETNFDIMLDIIDGFGLEFYYSSIMFLKLIIAYYPYRDLILYNWVEKMRKKQLTKT